MEDKSSPTVSSGSSSTGTLLFPVTFGIELELVLIPDIDGIRQKLLGYSDTGLAKLFEKCLGSIQGLTDKQKDDLLQNRAKFIAEFAERILKKTTPIKWAKCEEAAAAKKDGKFYQWWTVIEEVAIELKHEEWSVEIVSHPFLVTTTTEFDWQDQVRDVWTFLENNFTVIPDERGSTHVHMKKVASLATLEQELENGLVFGKEVSKFMVVWEPCLYLLSPSWRQRRHFCASNVIKIRALLTALRVSANRGDKYDTIFQRIDRFTQVNNLGDFVSGEREVSWNFWNLWKPRHSNPNPTYTIEYRRCPKPLLIADIWENVTISLSFVCAAIETGPGSELYTKMQSLPVILPSKGAKEPEEMGEALVQFGHEKFGFFIEFMNAAAEKLKIGQFMPAQEYSQRLDKFQGTNK